MTKKCKTARRCENCRHWKAASILDGPTERGCRNVARLLGMGGVLAVPRGFGCVGFEEAEG